MIAELKRNAIEKREIYSFASIVKTCEFTTIGMKTVFLFLCTFLTAFLSYGLSFVLQGTNAKPKIFFTLFIFSFVTQIYLLFKLSSNEVKKHKKIVIIFALLQGISIGEIVFVLNKYYSNVFSMILLAFLTVGILFMVSHFLYSTNLIKVNQKFQLCFTAASITFFFILLFSKFIQLSHFILIPITLFGLVLGCMMIFSDLKNAEFIVANKLSKEYEWTVAFGFHMTFIFLFMQIIRLLLLLGFFQERNNGEQ
ncbi:hypothetical protein C6B37_01580 [Candidatus Phytoplasma phoenicium]|uniref:Inhibitor of apoptosis-promoting Bax1 n=1 Tax=Candidatus Phytoplasma phoenicium TaxID=198422 RepID=A0A2S8NUB2_9MOLU|nr:hypothetical protein C6B37_01580 [Candidatus Phytoplasma phoenicium]